MHIDVKQLDYELVEEPTQHQNSYVILRDRENVLFVSTFQRKDGDFVTLTVFDHEEARSRSLCLSLSQMSSGWPVTANWVILSADVGCLQTAVVAVPRVVPIAGVTRSRELGPA